MVSHVQSLYFGIGGCSAEIFKIVLYLTEGIYLQRGCPQEILLNKFGLTSLITRKTKHSVLFLFKVVHGLQECISLLQQISIKVPTRNARNCNTFIYQPLLLNSPLNFMLASYTSMKNEIDIQKDK
jgi:hypothetical protein